MMNGGFLARCSSREREGGGGERRQDNAVGLIIGLHISFGELAGDQVDITQLWTRQITIPVLPVLHCIINWCEIDGCKDQRTVEDFLELKRIQNIPVRVLTPPIPVH